MRMDIEMCYSRHGIHSSGQLGAYFKSSKGYDVCFKEVFFSYETIRKSFNTSPEIARDPDGRWSTEVTYNGEKTKVYFKTKDFNDALNEGYKAIADLLDEEASFRPSRAMKFQELVNNGKAARFVNGKTVLDLPLSELNDHLEIISLHERNPRRMDYYFKAAANSDLFYPGHELMDAKAALRARNLPPVPKKDQGCAPA